MSIPIERRSVLKAAVLAELALGGTPTVNTKVIKDSVNQFLARGLDPAVAETLSSLVIKLLDLSVNPDPGTRLRQELNYRNNAEEQAADMHPEQYSMLGECGTSFEKRFAFHANFYAKILKDAGILPPKLSMIKSNWWPGAFRKFHYGVARLKEHNQKREAILKESLEKLLDLQEQITKNSGKSGIKKFVKVLRSDQDLTGLIKKLIDRHPDPAINSRSITDQFLIKPMKERLRKLKPDADLMELVQAFWKLDTPAVKTLEDLLRQSSLLSREELLNRLPQLLEQNEIQAIATTVENCMPQITQAYHDFRTLDQGRDIELKDEVPEYAAYKGRRLYPSHLSWGNNTIGKSLHRPMHP